MCQDIKGDEGQSLGSTIVSCLRSLGGQVAERLRSTIRVSIQKTLGLTSMHYIVDLGSLGDSYVLPEGVEGDEAELEAIKAIDASVTKPAAVHA